MSENTSHTAATLRIRSDPCELASVRQAVREAADEVGFRDEEVNKIMLAVDEALANVIRHAYGGPCDKAIDIRIEQLGPEPAAGIQVAIRDYGKVVSPEVIAGRPLDDVRPGGLGVHIIRTVMDEVSYRPAEGGGMLLTMKKKVGR